MIKRAPNLLAIIGLFICFWPFQSKAERIDVTGVSYSGYGRLVFNWRSAVGFEVQQEKGVVVVRFSEPLDANIFPATNKLENFLSDFQVSPDKSFLQFKLVENTDVKGYYSGTSVVLEFISKAPDSQNSPLDLSSVRVRAGEHADHSRIVFDWNSRVEYVVDQQGNNLRIKFKEPAKIAVNRIPVKSLRYIRNIKATVIEDNSLVTIETSGSPSIKHFRLGSKIVFDIGGKAREGKLLAKSDASAAEKEATSKNLQKDKKSSSGPTVLLPPESQSGTDSNKTNATLAKFPGASDGDAGKIEGAINGEFRQSSEGKQVFALTYAGKKVIGSAIFRRANYLWVAFDKRATLDTKTIVSNSNNIIQEINLIPSSKGTVLRMRTSPNMNPKLLKTDKDISLEFGPSPLTANDPLKVLAAPGARGGAKVLVPSSKPAKPIACTDPLIGDNLIIVPMTSVGAGVPDMYIYPQFDILASSQGVAIVPRIDDLRVRSKRNGVVIDSTGFLAISKVPGTDLSRAKRKKKKEVSLIIKDLNKFIVNDPLKLTPIRHNLVRAAAEGTGPEREKARLDLAKFFLANGFSAEIFGVIAAVELDRPQASKEALVRMLHGTANFLLGRYSEALVDFNDPSLKKNDEADLWRAAAESKSGNSKDSSKVLIRTERVIKKYPRRLKLVLGLTIAEAAIDVGKSKPAMRAIKVVNKIEPDNLEKARIKYVEGKLKELKKDFEGAIKDWDEVIRSKHLPTKVQAQVARTELLLKLKKMAPREAIKEYENLRYAWRGDNFEFETLRRLGGLYISEQFYREGLEVLKQAATYFRYNPKAPEAARLMSSTYNDLFLKRVADNIDAIKAVAIFEEFSELKPAGEKGDEMVRYLADRLVEVDLLERAGDLLQEQVRERLEGENKARIGAQLALIRMLARQNDLALATLNETDTGNQSENLKIQRRQLRARILFSQKEEVKALELLEEDESEGADLLRYEIYWKLKQWAKAVDVLRRLFKLANAKPGKPLNDKQASRLLNFAIALALSGGDRTIVRIRKDFGSAMGNHRLGEAFRLVTEPKTPGFLDPDLVSAKVLKAETFLSDYRERLKEGLPLSAIN